MSRCQYWVRRASIPLRSVPASSSGVVLMPGLVNSFSLAYMNSTPATPAYAGVWPRNPTTVAAGRRRA